MHIGYCTAPQVCSTIYLRLSSEEECTGKRTIYTLQPSNSGYHIRELHHFYFKSFYKSNRFFIIKVEKGIGYGSTKGIIQIYLNKRNKVLKSDRIRDTGTFQLFLTDKFDRVKVEELEVPAEGGDLVVGQVQASQLEVGSCSHIINIIQSQSKNIRPQSWGYSASLLNSGGVRVPALSFFDLNTVP